ncbi:amidohydrolase [Streptomyces phytohabitans]|uniref:amidohydrolase family protein n=1 Tax=Streptomyces phytohabitans TaxID=1150371 RepID=UPI00345B4E75
MKAPHAEIIDAHLHLPSPRNPWEHGEESFADLQTELLLAQLDAAGVDAAVLMSEAHCAPAARCRAAVARHPDRLATVLDYDEIAAGAAESSTAGPSAAEPGAAGLVARVAEQPGVLGLRLTTAWPPDNIERLRSGAYEDMLDAAETHGVPVCFLGPGHLPDLAAVARAHPSLPLVVDHFGLHQPPYMPADDPPWRDFGELLKLAELPNVSVKLSGAPTLSTAPYPYPDLRPPLERVLDAFGVDRCMWATDQHRVFGRLHGFPEVPRYPGYHSYAQGLHYLLDHVELSPSERTALFGGTARRVLGWTDRHRGTGATDGPATG